MTTIAEAEMIAKRAGREFLQECAELQGLPVSQVVDEALECMANCCRGAFVLRSELSVRVFTSVPTELDLPVELLGQWCNEVEDEFRMRPRPTEDIDSESWGLCPYEAQATGG